MAKESMQNLHKKIKLIISTAIEISKMSNYKIEFKLGDEISSLMIKYANDQKYDFKDRNFKLHESFSDKDVSSKNIFSVFDYIDNLQYERLKICEDDQGCQQMICENTKKSNSLAKKEPVVRKKDKKKKKIRFYTFDPNRNNYSGDSKTQLETLSASAVYDATITETSEGTSSDKFVDGIDTKMVNKDTGEIDNTHILKEIQEKYWIDKQKLYLMEQKHKKLCQNFDILASSIGLPIDVNKDNLQQALQHLANHIKSIKAEKFHLQNKYEQGLNFINHLLRKQTLCQNTEIQEFKHRNNRVSQLGKRSRKDLEVQLSQIESAQLDFAKAFQKIRDLNREINESPIASEK